VTCAFEGEDLIHAPQSGGSSESQSMESNHRRSRTCGKAAMQGRAFGRFR
jgi:hypothetical protein